MQSNKSADIREHMLIIENTLKMCNFLNKYKTKNEMRLILNSI